jgi:N utilization substance protein A
MNSELLAVIAQIQREKGINSEKIIKAVESALLTAAKKRYGSSDNIQVKVDPETGEIEAFYIKKIVDQVTDPKLEILLEEAKQMDSDAEIGDEIGSPIAMADFGRIAAQTAKQVIFQKVREAELEAVYKEYSVRQGEIISGMILGQERRNYIVDLGKTEALLPYTEQVPRESYRRGDRIRAYLLEVKPSSRGPQLILSRSHPDFVGKLFELEVPEVAEKIVEIKGVVREPGDRTKIAVTSHDSAVDPVGACVGVKGSRVQAVVRELRGEKIDIIAWTNDPRTFIGEALSPAVIDKVGINETEKSALVVVADQQLSLAIGKKGQNVRLAAKLTGWKIDIMSESEYDKARAQEREKEISEAIAQTQKEQQAREEKEAQREVREEVGVARAASLLDLPGVGEKLAESLRNHGFETVEKIAGATPEALMEVPMIGQKTAQKLIPAAKELIRSLQGSKLEETPPSTEGQVNAGQSDVAEEEKPAEVNVRNQENKQ